MLDSVGFKAQASLLEVVKRQLDAAGRRLTCSRVSGAREEGQHVVGSRVRVSASRFKFGARGA